MDTGVCVACMSACMSAHLCTLVNMWRCVAPSDRSYSAPTLLLVSVGIADGMPSACVQACCLNCRALLHTQPCRDKAVSVPQRFFLSQSGSSPRCGARSRSTVRRRLMCGWCTAHAGVDVYTYRHVRRHGHRLVERHVRILVH